MIGALLRRGLWHQRRLLPFAAAGMVAFEMLIIHIGAVMDRGPGMEQLQELLDKMPQILQDLVKGQVGELSFPAFAAFGFEHPAILGIGLAYVVFLGTVPAGERDAGVLDLLLARPLQRHRYLVATLAQVLLVALLLPGCMLLGAAIALAQVEAPADVTWARYASSAAGLSALLLAWGGIAMLLSTGGVRRGTAVVQVLGAILCLFLVDVLSQFSSVLDQAQWLSPFHYFNPMAYSVRMEGAGGDALVLLGVFAAAAAVAFRRFDRQDL